MDKNIWVIANWKSNKTIAEALDWVSKVGSYIPKKENFKVVVCPTYSCISEVKKAIKVGNFPLLVGAQDLSPFKAGAYTGEESAVLLKDLIEFSILGHSERRKNFGETDEMVAQKVQQALANNIIALVCVQGEETLIPEQCSLIAYEPIWAISTGLTNTPGAGKADNPENAEIVAKFFKQKYGNNLEVIYGGSVSSANAKGFVSQPNINGILIGNASLDPGEFIAICKSCLE
ncbi:triosephosphate isomerase [Candidatus Daviesbacteria bacterium]|nr:triosephosphate isomerase [Candidatus Daviesbacteria bacterium]MBI4038829.1 triosephosphate isomerase [Candidatus Daviesbacteria bacterium]